MQDLSPQARIELLIRQLEQELTLLSSSQQSEIKQMREVNVQDLRNLEDQFEQRIVLINGQYQLRITNLEQEIAYLKELIGSQRLMMEDNLSYTKGLEDKLNSPLPPIL